MKDLLLKDLQPVFLGKARKTVCYSFGQNILPSITRKNSDEIAGELGIETCQFARRLNLFKADEVILAGTTTEAVW